MPIRRAIATIFNLEYINHIGVGRWLWRYPLWQGKKRLGRRPLYFRLPHGLVIRLPRRSHFSSALFLERGFVDWGSELALIRMMRTGQTFLDVGAHFGYYSLMAAHAGLRCVAFEPDPRNAPLFAEAAGGQENIELRRLAVSESPGTAAFVLHSSSAQSRIATGATQSGELVQVAVTTVDEVAFGEKLPVGGIKIDVEGFDRQVLRGAERTLRELRPVVCTESEWDPELEAFATRVGYRVGAFVGNPDHAIEFSFAPGRGRPTCPMLFLVPEERVDDMRTVAAGIALGRQE